MHTFKPGMPVTINEGAEPQGYYSLFDFDRWKELNSEFEIYRISDGAILVKGVQHSVLYSFSPSDLTPKSEEKLPVRGDKAIFDNVEVEFVRMMSNGIFNMKHPKGNNLYLKRDCFEWVKSEPKSEVFKVRVVKGRGWYNNKIGEEFNVIKDPEGNAVWLMPDNSGYGLNKSDCIVVTDQKFKLNQPVLYKGMKAKVSEISVRNNQATEVVVEGENGRHKYYTCCEHDLLEHKPDQPTSIPFTEELFNEGKKINMPIRETLYLTESVAVTIWRNSDFTECHYDISTYRIDVNEHTKKHHNVIASFKSLFDFTEYLNAKIKHLNSF